jgi:hypothetical protein
MDNRTTPPMMTAPSRPSLDGLSAEVVAKIEKFNARPMRREDDCRVLGWSVVGSAT